jgi:hypothetical protein
MSIHTIRPNRYDYLKVLALLTMIIDHIWYFLYPEIIRLRVIGRISFPLFLLLVGYNTSYKSSLSLWSIALLLQWGIYTLYFFGYILYPIWNILLAIVVTRVLLWRTSKQSVYIQIIIFVLSLVCSLYTNNFVDYGTLSVSFGLIGWRMNQYNIHNLINKRWRVPIIWVIMIIIYMIFIIVTSNFWTYIYRALSVIGLILFYCGMRLYRGNNPLLISKMSDSSVLRLSKNALAVYIGHVAILWWIATRLK